MSWIEESRAVTREKYKNIFREVQGMGVKHKRNIFQILKNTSDVDENVFIPFYGMHFGEFAVFQILTEHTRCKRQAEPLVTPKGKSDG